MLLALEEKEAQRGSAAFPGSHSRGEGSSRPHLLCHEHSAHLQMEATFKDAWVPMETLWDGEAVGLTPAQSW